VNSLLLMTDTAVNSSTGIREFCRRHSLLLLFLLALVIRLLYNFILLSPTVRNWDAADYDILALRLAQGHGFFYVDGVLTASRPPLFPMLIAFFYLLFGRSLIVTAMIQAVIGALAAPLAAIYTRQVTQKPGAGLLAGIIFSIYPAFVDVGSTLLSEPLTIVLVLATGVVLEYGRGKSVWVSALAGVFLGLVVLSHPNLVLLLVLFPLRYLLWGESWRKALGSLLIAGAAVVLVIAPWTIRNYQVFHQPVFISTQGGQTFWRHGHHLDAMDDSPSSPFPHYEVAAVKEWISSPGPAELYLPIFSQGNLFYARAYGWNFYNRFAGLNDAQADALFFRLGWQFCTEHPGLALSFSLKSALRFFTPIVEQNVTRLAQDPYDVAWGTLLPLWALSWIWWLRGRRKELIWAWGTTGVVYLSCVIFTVLTRYRLPGEVMMIPVVAAGIHKIWLEGRRRLILVLVGILLVINIVAATQVQTINEWLNMRASQLVGAKTSE
jgi:4-amino-4-deoxy-L-arabinose transferase-like glycosyltransferase